MNHLNNYYNPNKKIHNIFRDFQLQQCVVVLKDIFKIKILIVAWQQEC